MVSPRLGNRETALVMVSDMKTSQRGQDPVGGRDGRTVRNSYIYGDGVMS